jgi:hypothetical protein
MAYILIKFFVLEQHIISALNLTNWIKFIKINHNDPH